MSELFVLSGADIGRSFEIAEGARLGRSPECEVRLKDRSISRLHAHVERQVERFVLIDDDSRNGLFVDGGRVRKIQLVDGLEFQVGELQLRFRHSPAAQQNSQPVASSPSKSVESAPAQVEPARVEPSTEAPAPEPTSTPSPTPSSEGEPAEIQLEGDELKLDGLGEELDLGEELEWESEVSLDADQFVTGGGVAAKPQPAPKPSVPPVDSSAAGSSTDLESAPKLSRRERERAEILGAARPKGSAQSLGAPGRVLQYHRVEQKRGLQNAQLGQLPLWSRMLLILLVMAVAGGIFFLVFRTVRGL